MGLQVQQESLLLGIIIVRIHRGVRVSIIYYKPQVKKGNGEAGLHCAMSGVPFRCCHAIMPSDQSDSLNLAINR